RNTVNSRNARIIMLGVGQRPNRVVAEMAGCSVQWVRQIIHRFNDAGIDGITWYPWFQVRAARVFTADLCEQIAEFALSPPIALIGMTQWSLPKLRQYLIEQKVVFAVCIGNGPPAAGVCASTSLARCICCHVIVIAAKDQANMSSASLPTMTAAK